MTHCRQRGPVPLVDVFEGRRQLIAYFHMWHTGKPAEAQCEGCTFFTGQVRELSYLHSRDVTYATFCQGPYEESAAYRDFMGWDVPWYSAAESAEALLAGRWFGMQVCYLRHEDRVFETYWSTGRAAEALGPTYALLDMTVYGRQETWEDSPQGWPQVFGTTGDQFRTDGRPTAQWSRLAAGRSDDLRTARSLAPISAQEVRRNRYRCRAPGVLLMRGRHLRERWHGGVPVVRMMRLSSC
jgi:predicted dithiol-disulfide oxidoreductase (DUF899 family)